MFRRRWIRNPWVRVTVAVFAFGAGVMALTHEPVCNGAPMDEDSSVCVQDGHKTYAQKKAEATRAGYLAIAVGLVSFGFGASKLLSQASDRRRIADAAVARNAALPGGGAPPPAPTGVVLPPMPTASADASASATPPPLTWGDPSAR